MRNATCAARPVSSAPPATRSTSRTHGAARGRGTTSASVVGGADTTITPPIVMARILVMWGCATRANARHAIRCARSFKAGTVMPGRRRMQVAIQDAAESTPVAPERSASSFISGLLALEEGAVHHGTLRGALVAADGDLIFTTATTGWGEILTDPSYAGQLVVLTHPMAGNYRIDPAELESDRVHARGLIVTRLVTPPAGPGMALEDVLIEAGIPALEGVDTRALTLQLRRGAARRAAIRPAI